jgi:hypothetical protein
VPGAFVNADEGVKHVAKMEFTTVFSDQSSDPVKLETGFSPDRLLLDFGALVPDAFDPQKLIRDCELVRQAAIDHPKELGAILEAFQNKTPEAGYRKAFKIAKQIGVTEEDAIRAGGGLLWLVVFGALVVMASGCEHCHASHPTH